MYQRDYLLRMIEMIAELIAGILGLIRKGKYEEAQKEINQTYTTMLKEDAAFIFRIPTEKLCDTLLQEHNYTHDHLKILAQLLKVEGDLQAVQGEINASKEYYRKALALLEFLDRESGEFDMKRQNQIQELRKQFV